MTYISGVKHAIYKGPVSKIPVLNKVTDQPLRIDRLWLDVAPQPAAGRRRCVASGDIAWNLGARVRVETPLDTPGINHGRVVVSITAGKGCMINISFIGMVAK